MEQTVGQRILDLLQKKGMSKKELAITAGISQATISYYTNGERIPNGPNLVDLARALHTTTDYLLGHESAGDPASAFYQTKSAVTGFSGEWTPEQKAELASLLFGGETVEEPDLAFCQAKSAAIGYGEIWTLEQKAELAGALFAER